MRMPSRLFPATVFELIEIEESFTVIPSRVFPRSVVFVT